MILGEIFGFETFLGQLIALVTFFAFPAIQYYILKRFSKKTANPELWYLPAYGFRLVIKNIPSKKTLSDLKYKTILRKRIPENTGSSVATLIDEILVEREEFFLFGGYDQILVSFQIVETESKNLQFVFTDKLGNAIKKFSLKDFDNLIIDYSANIENMFNFDVKVLKRVELKSLSLMNFWKEIQLNNVEQAFIIDKTVEVG